MNTKFYFDHDYGARNDDRILELRAEFGWKGYGIFWGLIEMICENNGGLQSQALAGLAVGLGVAKAELETIINLCLDKGLLYNNNGLICSKRIDTHFTRRRKLSDAGRRGGQSSKDGGSEATLKPGLSHPKATPKPREERRGDERKEDFIDQIISVFKEEFEKSRSFEFVISNREKERSAVGKLIQLQKNRFPGINSEESLEKFSLFFKGCMEIEDEWLKRNMSPAIINSQYNQIMAILKKNAPPPPTPEHLRRPYLEVDVPEPRRNAL